MVNYKLLEVMDADILIGMGFTQEDDGSGDPRGVDYNIRNDNYHLQIDAWGEVTLGRLNPATDPITIHCEDLSDLQSVIDWIE